MKTKYRCVIEMIYDINYMFEYYENDTDVIGDSFDELGWVLAEAFKVKETGSGAGFGYRDLTYGNFESVDEALDFATYLEECTDGHFKFEGLYLTRD